MYPALVRHSPQWPQYKELLEYASALGFATEKYRRIKDTDTPLALSVQDQLDDLLEHLVTEYDEEELPYQREAAYHRAVIDNGGDTGRAHIDADSISAALEQTMDAVSLQTQIAVHPDAMGVSVGAQKLAIGVGQDDLRAAIGDFTTGYRRGFIDVVEIVLAQDHSQFAVAVGFPGWKTDTATTQERSEAGLGEVWHQSYAAYIESVRFKPGTAIGAAVLAGAVGLFCIAAFDLVGILLTLAVVAGAGWWVTKKKRAADAMVRQAESDRGQALQYSIDIYRTAVAEFVDARLAYQEADGNEQELLNLVDTWPTVVGQEKGH